MAETTNEMNMPMISAPAMGVVGGDVQSVMTAPEMSYDSSIAIGAPTNGYDVSAITVYANTISPVTYAAANDTIVAFDIVFSVGINCGDSTKTYQVVKRIGIDKCKLACEAESSTPVSVVEAKKSDALKEEAAATRKRFRRLAGLE
jgi:hypothetical protein